jgi:hypothetical protein
MIKNFFGTLPTEAFSRPVVEKLSNSIYIFLRNVGKLSPLREKLTQ